MDKPIYRDVIGDLLSYIYIYQISMEFQKIRS